MPYRIICPRIVPDVKPFELIAAMMAAEGLGPLRLAKKMNRPKLQPQIHRFTRGEVLSPSRGTAEPIAAYFGIPVDAIYDEKVATLVANERKLTVLPMVAAIPKPKPATKAESLSPEALKFAHQYDKLDPHEQQRLRMLLHVARDGLNPAISNAPETVPVEKAATARDLTKVPLPENRPHQASRYIAQARQPGRLARKKGT